MKGKISYYKSHVGEILIIIENGYLVGLYFVGQKHFIEINRNDYVVDDNNELIKRTKEFLDVYFSGLNPKIENIPLFLKGTNFQKLVWDELLNIPYGETRSYGDIAKKIALKMHKEKMSSRAVGSAIGKNPISIIVPCHRVIGKNGALTGYAGGIDKKRFLLNLENKNEKF